VNGGVTRAEAPVCGDLVMTRSAQVGQTTRSCDEVNKGLVSRAEAPMRWATEFVEGCKIG
jgi:hypothetical protein